MEDWREREKAAVTYVASLLTSDLSDLVERLRYRDWEQSGPYAINGCDREQRVELWTAIGKVLERRAPSTFGQSSPDRELKARWRALSVVYPDGQIKPRSWIEGPPPEAIKPKPVQKTDKPSESESVPPTVQTVHRRERHRLEYAGLSDLENWQTAIITYINNHISDRPDCEVTASEVRQRLRFDRHRETAEAALRNLIDRNIFKFPQGRQVRQAQYTENPCPSYWRPSHESRDPPETAASWL